MIGEESRAPTQLFSETGLSHHMKINDNINDGY
jgi:hypothetical protein